MIRESINITVTEPLRRAQIKPRLEALAQITGLSPTLLAGRSLTVGLEVIEQDPRRVFPGVAAPPAACASASGPTPHDSVPSVAQQGEATQRTESAALSMSPPKLVPRQDAAPRSALLPDEKPATATRRESKPGHVSTQEAARSLGYRAPSAFTQHVQRHPNLKRCSQKAGNARQWDLGKLRAEYERNGWTPK